MSGLARKRSATASRAGAADGDPTPAEETAPSLLAMFLPQRPGSGQAGRSAVPSGIVGRGIQQRPSGGDQAESSAVPSGLVERSVQRRPSGGVESSHAAVPSGIVGWERDGRGGPGSERTEEVAPEAAPQPRDLAHLRGGTPGKIRSAADLSSEDVAHVMNAQLQSILPGDIQAIIGAFPPAEQAQARIVLARSSGFARMEGLNPLRDAVELHLGQRGTLFTPGKGSLADNLEYTSLKGVFAHRRRFRTTSVKTIPPGTVVILDDVMLAMIESDPVFASRLREQRAVLLQPRGFTGGINMFNAGSVEAIRQRTQRVLDRANARVASGGGEVRFDDAVTWALDETIQDALGPAASGSGPGFDLQVVDPARYAATSDTASAEQLNGGAGITAERLDAVLANVGEADRALLRELLAQQSEVFSPRRMSNELLAMHQHHLQLAAQHHVQTEDVYYLIYVRAKSYGMVAMAHRQATGTPVDRYISGVDELKERRLGPDTMLVILDDVAGSGDSLNQAREDARKVYAGQIILSPMISTMNAERRYNAPLGIATQYANTTYAPQKVTSVLEYSPMLRELPRAVANRILELVGDLGYSKNATSVAFPYMAPDNNNLWFADQLAKEFILNKSRAAVQTDETWQPPAPRLEAP